MTKPNLYSVGLFAAVLVAAMLVGSTSAFAVPPLEVPGAGVCEDPAPRTEGFWRRVCKKDHPDQPDRSILTDELCEDLNPDPNRDPCERARSQFAAVQYNVISGRLDATCTVDAIGEDVAAAIALVDALIDEGTKSSCKAASSLAAAINEGGVSPTVHGS